MVLVADLHLGYNIGCKQMEQMTEKINEQKPDLVVVAGDIFDNEYDAIRSPEKLSKVLRSIKSAQSMVCMHVTETTISRKRFWRDLPLAVRKRKRVPRRWMSFWRKRGLRF